MKRTSRLTSFFLVFVRVVTTFVGIIPPLEVSAVSSVYVKTFTSDVDEVTVADTVTFTIKTSANMYGVCLAVRDVNADESLTIISTNKSSTKNEMTEFADYLYIKLAYVHYKKLKVGERKKVLDILKDYMKKKDISLNIPMLSDANAYFEGYELFIQSFDSKDKKKVMRMLFDAIVEMMTSEVQDETERRKLIHSLEYDQLSEESDQLLVCEYVKQHMGQVDNDAFNMNVYFDKGRQFAQIEHVRWNAYVRTEGFRRAGIPDKKYRKYKMHYDIVPVELLTFADCVKDI